MVKAILALALLIPAAQEPRTFTVSGTVKFDGPVPKPKPNMQLEGDPACAACHAVPPAKDDLVVSPAGGVRWALVYVKKGLEGKTFQPPAEPALVDQVGCIYTPHVIGVMAGQVVNFRNSDKVLHNVNGSAAFANKGFNFAQPPGTQNGVTFANPESTPIRMACNVHPFMAMHVAVLDHPFFAVSDADGKFEIRNLPPGNYTLGVWHERLQKQDREIVVTGALTETFTLKEK
jgi:plastocyanin